MSENKKPSFFDFSRFTVFKERGAVFRTVVVLVILIVLLFIAYRVTYMFMDARFPFPK